jgi:hypothetical protein
MAFGPPHLLNGRQMPPRRPTITHNTEHFRKEVKISGTHYRVDDPERDSMFSEMVQRFHHPVKGIVGPRGVMEVAGAIKAGEVHEVMTLL